MALLSEAAEVDAGPENPYGNGTPPPTEDPAGTTVEDLYGPPAPEVQELEVPDVPDPVGAEVTLNDPSVAEVDVPGTAEVGDLAEAEGIVGEQTGLTEEQQVDMELARILEQDSPLMARARTQAGQYANTRGLQNTSMAAGYAEGAMVDRAMPMAQQNAAQAAERERENTRLRQEATTFTAEEENRRNALSAQLGTDVSMFNADQINLGERLSAELATAVEMNDTDAINRIEMQLQDLIRDANAQQADLDFAAEEREAVERQNYNLAIIDRITTMNEQYLRGEQAMDLATIQGDYQLLISTNATAGALSQTLMTGIATILDDPEMTPAEATLKVNRLVKEYEGALAMLAEINGMDFGDETEGTGTNSGTDSGDDDTGAGSGDYYIDEPTGVHGEPDRNDPG